MRIIQKTQQTFRFFLLDLWVLFSLSPCLEFLPELKLSSLSRESASDESFSEELFKMQSKTGVNELLEMIFDITVLHYCLLFSQIFKHLSWAALGVGRGHRATPFIRDFLSVAATPF